MSADDDEHDASLGDDVPGARFERRKRAVGLVLGPLAAIVAAALASGSVAPALPALMALCVVWWITEALPAAAVALLAAVGAVVTGLAPPDQAFGAFGKPLLFLFVGSFFVAEAVRIHGLGERMARAMVRRASGRRSLLIAVSLATFVMSMFMSNAAATAIVLPLGLSVATTVGDDRGGDGAGGRDGRYAAAMVLAIAWGASVGGLGTPVGTPPNGIGLRALRDAGFDIGFVQWMTFGVPIGAALLVVMWLVLIRNFGIRAGHAVVVPDAAVARRWGRGEHAVLISMTIAGIGWLTPSVVELVAPGSAALAWVKAHVTEEVVALIAGCLLFVLPGDRDGVRRPALTWSEATKIDWGVILLFAGGSLLGDLARTTGMSAQWGTALVDATGVSSTWAITALVAAIAILLSELTSNTATATLMAPLAAQLAIGAGVPVVPCVLGATLGASFGFMLPISTAPNAMAYATGRVTMGQMMRSGVIFDVLGFVTIVVGLRLIGPLLGLW